MKKKLKVIAIAMIAVMTSVNLYVAPIDAVTTTCDSYAGTNIEKQNYDRWSSVVNSYLEYTDDGKLMRVQNTPSDGVAVEYYDKKYNFISSKKISAELPIFGGFYASDSNYFLVTGQTNSGQSADVEVVRITKYDKKWNRIASTGLYDCNTTVPFDAGSCRMDMLNNYLIIRTSHEMYASSDGYNHQSNMTIQVDTSTMTITDSYSGVMNTGWGYASHSFNQFIKMEGNKIVAVDHGDAYPRSIALFKYTTDASKGSFVPTYNKQCEVIDVLEIPGAIGENATNATIGGFEISDTSYLIAGNSVVQDSNNLSRNTRNIYVAAVDKDTDKVTLNWITNYKEGENSTRTPQFVKVNDDKYVLLWSIDDMVYYVQVDGSGKKVGKIYSMSGHLSDCVPEIVSTKIVWYTWQDGRIIFYEINLNDLSRISVTEINNGHDYINNGVVNGVAHLTCSICGTSVEKEVPTSMSVWWNEGGIFSGYSSGFDANQDVGDVLHCWISGADKNVRLNVDNTDIVSIETVVEYNDGYIYELKLKQAGKATLTASHIYNSALTKEYNLTVKSKVAVEINGFQISSVNKGFRTVYSVSDPAAEVVSEGMIYGLSDYVNNNSLIIGSSNIYVHNFEATKSGKIDSTFSQLDSATSYAMTMQFEGVSHEFFEADMKVRAYAELNNGTYLYSDIVTCNVYDIADKIYTNNWMNTKAAHTYLYTDILSIVKPSYKKVEFSGGNSLVVP